MAAFASGGVIRPSGPLSVGGRLVIDGETITISSVDGADVRGFTEGGERVRFVLTRAEDQPAEVCNEEWRFGLVLLDAGALSDAQLREAAELLAHLNEASFGYRSGDPGRASPGEPRAEFDPMCTTLRQRLEAKASELGCSAEKLRKRRRALQRQGLGALVDRRQTRAAIGPWGRLEVASCDPRRSRGAGGGLGRAQDAVSLSGRESLGARERRAV